MTKISSPTRVVSADANKLLRQDEAAHRWYRFVLSFPPHLVRQYLERFELESGHRVLDPFCGTGTTLVECKKCGITGVGLEAHPMAHFATRVKVDWTPDPKGLVAHSQRVASRALEELQRDGIEDGTFFSATAQPTVGLQTLSAEAAALLLKNCIGPLPLHKSLVLLEALESERDAAYYDHERLAFAKALVTSISNLQFGPEVGVGPAKEDAPVVEPWLASVAAMATDLRALQELGDTDIRAHRADARSLADVLEPDSIDGVITSPPYPNEKDYTRTTRLEAVLLGFIRTKGELRELKRSLVRSNTRGVYKGDDDDRWVAEHPEIQRVAKAIEARRKELGKTSGFERLYHRVTTLYFGGMLRHFKDLRSALRPGARLAYVVGDQASYLRVMIRTGAILADLASSLGFEVIGIDLFRTRLATATREQLREEVVLLRWPGTK